MTVNFFFSLLLFKLLEPLMLSLDLRQSLLGVDASLLCFFSRMNVCGLSISSLLSLVNLVRVKIYRHI